MKRRAYLGLLGAGVLAGCSGGESNGTETSLSDSGAGPSTERFSERWSEELAFNGSFSELTTASDATADSVFFGGKWGLVALDVTDGSRRWENDEWDEFIAIHADSDGVIAYTQSFDIVSFDPADGSEQWRASTTGDESSLFNTALTPSYFVTDTPDGVAVYERGSGDIALERDGVALILATDDTLVGTKLSETVALALPTGTERWTYESVLSTGAAIDDGRLIGYESWFIADKDSMLKALDLDTGEEIWSENLGSISMDHASIVTDSGVAMFLSNPGDGESTLYGHDLRDGSQLWTQDVGQMLLTSEPVAANGVVIAPGKPDGRNQLYFHTVQNGEQLATVETSFGVSNGVVANRVFVGREVSTVTAYNF